MSLYDVSATGVSIFIKSGVSFPNGFIVEGMADDTDPLAFAEMTVAEADTNINGDLVVWGKPQVMNPTLAVVAGSPADDNLQVMLAARENGVREEVEMTVTYPDGSNVTASEGVLTTGTKGKGTSSAGRTVTRSYGFAFGTHSERRADR